MIYKRSQPRSRITRAFYASWAASLLFFLCYSAPHRVHHFFDQIQPASHATSGDHHGETDQRDNVPTSSDCVFQAAANRCAFGLTAQPLVLAQTTLIQEFVVFRDTTHQSKYLASVFHIRAPPKA